LLSCRQEFLVPELEKRSFSFEDELEMADDPIDNLELFDEGDNPHLATGGRTNKTVNVIWS